MERCKKVLSLLEICSDSKNEKNEIQTMYKRVVKIAESEKDKTEGGET